MRPILYRAKAFNRDPKMNYRTDYKNGDWVYGLVSRLDEYSAEMTNTDGVSGIDVDPETICEWTGLTDNNGTKIFEGDIVRVDDKYDREVAYSGQCTAFVICQSNQYGGYDIFYPMGWGYDNYMHTFEVIGNVHDKESRNEKLG